MSKPTEGPNPLAGIRVLDCSRVLAGPFATMLMGDLGADVIKVEHLSGDDTRSWGPPFWGSAQDGLGAYFTAVNRNKRSIAVDLKTDAGREILHSLAERTDVLVHNFRPSTAERLGVDAQTMHEHHPRLLVASVAGFPDAGAERDRPAYDLLAQAVSGLMAITGEASGPPTKVGVALLDLLAGLELCVGILATLVGRKGASHTVSVSLVETGVTSLVNVLANHLASGVEPERFGNAHPNIAPYRAFNARDGYLVIAAGNDAQFERLVETLGVQTLAREYPTNALRLGAGDALTATLAAAIARWRRDDLVDALRDADVPSGPVMSVAEAVESMNRAYDGNWIEHADGLQLAPNPILIDGRRVGAGGVPPRLGAHTDEVLRDLGYELAAITELRANSIVC